MKYNLVAAIPVKDEEWIIGKTLDSLSRFCNKIVVQDDGSLDKTKEICESFDKVDFGVRSPNSILETGMSGRGKADLLAKVLDYDPDYVLMLDADEIPTPNIVEFLDNIDSTINAFSVRMINLYKDRNHYRTDSFVTSHGININHNPFSNPCWRKTVLLKADSVKEVGNYRYQDKAIGSVSKYHPLPENIPSPVIDTEGFYIMHYGKLNEKYTSGEKHKSYARIEEQAGTSMWGSYENIFEHHETCRKEGVPTYEECKSDWFWK